MSYLFQLSLFLQEVYYLLIYIYYIIYNKYKQKRQKLQIRGSQAFDFGCGIHLSQFC